MYPIMMAIARGVPPEVAGIPSWVLDGLSAGALIGFIVIGIATGRLWTKGQVDVLTKQHDREVEDLKQRYETHLTRTVELWKGRADDALKRETDWKNIALDWQKVSTLLGDAIDPLHVQSAATLEIVRQLQAYQQANPPRPGRRT